MASDFKTVLTAVGTTELQINPVEWTLVSLYLETAGPVVAGNKQELSPLSSGKGVSLGAIPRYFLLSPGERLYTLAGSINRVSMASHTLPNLFQLLMKLDAMIGAMAKKFGIR